MTHLLPVANLINFVTENAIVSVAVFIVFASVCLGLFKGAKHCIRAMSILLAIALVGLGAFVVYLLYGNDIDGLIAFGIAWLPTIIFLIIIIIATTTGIRRGLRKSLILMLHSVLIAGLCLGMFFFCVKSTLFDKILLNVINMFMGSGGLQSQLGVRADCETLREVLVEFFIDYSIQWGDFGILLAANSAYILTLVDMAYRIVFAVLFFIVYEILLFIMYLIYLIFYSERKYKKKKNIRFAMNKTDSSYHRHPVGGGCVGLVRGLISGIIALSFIGSVFFIATGGTGASKLPEDISFGENYNQYISIYRSIENYGDKGIFKVLNAIDDPEDTPYYLFVADMIFSGGLDDEEHDVKGNIKLREELAAYTGFAKNSFALLMKYDTDGKIRGILSGESSDDTMDAILGVFTNPEFKVEFDDLIDNFDAQTYIINFALSLTDAIIANIDEVSFMDSVSDSNKELLQLLFKRNYLSDSIPDERELKNSAEGATYIPPYITINHLFTKKDVRIVLDIALSILSNKIDVKDPHSIASNLLPSIEELSILSVGRSQEMDPVLGRLYCYFDNVYLTDEGEDGITYAEIKSESVSWTREIRALLGVADGLVTVYDAVSKSTGDDIFTSIASLFDETSADYEKNVRAYEELTTVISDSKILSRVLCSQKIHSLLAEQLKKIDGDIYFPANISYENRYDGEGNLISHGEAYYALRGLRLVVDKENKQVIDSLLQSSDSFNDLIIDLAGIITKADPYAENGSLAIYFSESTLLRSIISAVITGKAGDVIAVPALSLETVDEQTVNLINKTELRQLLEALPELADYMIELTEDEISAETVNKILNSEVFNSLLDSGNKIVEGTIAKAIIDVLGDNEAIIISKTLKNYENWVTIKSPGELRKFLKSKDILSIDIEALMKGEGFDGDEIYDKIKALEEDDILELLDSEVFYYSASNLVYDGDFGFKNFQIIVPNSICVPLEDDTISNIITKEELISVFFDLKDFNISSDMSDDTIIKTLVQKRKTLQNSAILSASVVNFILSDETICSALDVPQLYLDAGEKERLAEYDSSNIWHSELPNLIGAIDEIFGISNMDDEQFTFNKDTVSENTNKLILKFNENSVSQNSVTRLDVCYASEIIRNKLTFELDKALNGADQTDESLIDIAVRDTFKTGSQSGKVYSKSEISALVNALLLLDINDIDDINNGKFTSVSQFRNNIDGICASGIIRGIVTKKIDGALTEKIIDINVKNQIKVRASIYPAEEISALVYALDEFGMDDINDLDNFDYSENLKNLTRPSEREPDSTKLTVIYRSDIVAGVVTKTVKDNFNQKGLAYSSSAERSDIAVLKEQELNSLVSLLGNSNLDNFDIGTVSLANVRDRLMPDSDGNPSSYLLLANFTKTITDNDAIYVPENVYRNQFIVAIEAIRFIDAVIALRGDNMALDDWDVDADMVLPDRANRQTLLQSEIMRATFSQTVFTANSEIAFSQSNIEIRNRIYGTESSQIAMISTAQLEILFDIIESCTQDSELKIPSFISIGSIKMQSANLELLCRFDGTRYSMSKVILSEMSVLPAGREYWYVFAEGKFAGIDVEILTAEEILYIIKV